MALNHKQGKFPTKEMHINEASASTDNQQAINPPQVPHF